MCGTKMKTFVETAIKLVISLAVFFTVIRNMDYTKILETLVSTDIFMVVLVLFFLLISLLLLTLKWKMFIDKIQLRSLRVLFNIYWAAGFMSVFNLGAVGSEFYKILLFENKKGALAASLTDKFYAFLWHIIMFSSGITVFFVFKRFSPVELIGTILLYFILVILYIRCENKLRKMRFLRRIKIVEKILNFTEMHSNKILLHSAYSLLFMVSSFVAYSVALRSAGISFNPMFFLFIPVLHVLVTVPISFQGLGVREFVLVNYAFLMGFDQASATAASLLIFTVFIMFKLLGIIPFMTLKTKLQGDH